MTIPESSQNKAEGKDHLTRLIELGHRIKDCLEAEGNTESASNLAQDLTKLEEASQARNKQYQYKPRP
jgi:hypothetical protein